MFNDNFASQCSAVINGSLPHYQYKTASKLYNIEMSTRRIKEITKYLNPN